MKTNPELIDDHGVGQAYLKDLNIIVKANPSVKDGFFQFDFGEIVIDIDDFGLEMEGGDLAIAIDFFSETLKEFIRQYILGKLNEQTKSSLQDIINELLLTVPRDI